MATIDEIEQAIRWLQGARTKNVTILKCTSSYPTPVAESNLRGIETLRNALGKYAREIELSYGWSDHTVSQAVILRAIYHYNVRFVEFHLDLDGKGEEFKSGHCWLPQQVKDLIRTVRDGFLADGSGEIQPSPSEQADREWRRDPRDGLRPLAGMRKKF